MFIDWLSDQSPRRDVVGEISRLVGDDINNGCLNYARSATDIQEHFFIRHTKNFTALEEKLRAAFKEYALSLRSK